MALRVDGRIIGTGEADFTKGNTAYVLDYEGKTFQLVDVPGIEGDETKYAGMVHQAVAKAHLVFYVNGTNKKPEKATAEKIRSYLRRGTQVCPLINVRGSADAYEFDEDRVSLEDHTGDGTALQQTIDVLEPTLGTDVLMPGHCVQGLLGFSSLAYQASGAKTSIHSSRDRDLVIQQRNYLKHFESATAMYDFSQMQAVAHVLHGKLAGFEGEIVESNKLKVRELLTETLDILEKTLSEHRRFMAKVEPEFEKCREACSQALKTFERLTEAGRKNVWNALFNEVSDEADRIVAEHLSDSDQISQQIKAFFDTRQQSSTLSLRKQLEETSSDLQESVKQAMTRLVEDVQRVEFQQRFTVDENPTLNVHDRFDLGPQFGLGDYGSMAFQIGSYAATGAMIGSSFPVIGTLIGAAAGAAVGVIMSVVSLLMSKEKRIRKAQAKVQDSISQVRDEVLEKLPQEMGSLVAAVRQELDDILLSQVDDLYQNLHRPLKILEQQIALMTNLKNQLEKMPHGTIQAVQ